MYPILFTIGNFPIHTFGVLVLLGVVTGLWWVKRDAPRIGIDGEDMVNLAVEVFIAGLIGSRILFVLHNWDAMYADLPFYQVFNLRQGGLIWYGGLLTAAPVGFWRAKAWGVPVRPACDAMAICMLVGLAIGRIGCLAAGDDHGSINEVSAAYAAENMNSGKIITIKANDHKTASGRPCVVCALDPVLNQGGVRYAEETWYTLTFRNPDALLDDHFRNRPLLPAQPAMSFGVFCCFFFLASLRRKLQHAPSAITALLFVVYPTHRFLVEYLRGDPIRGYVTGPDFPIFGQLSTSQAISMPLIPVALAAFLFIVWKYKDAEVVVPEIVKRGSPGGGPSQAESKAKDEPKTKDEPKADEPKQPEADESKAEEPASE